MIRLTVKQARAVHLAAQGLTIKPKRKATKPDVLSAIRQLGALQIDTISVVARSPYLVLWSRLGAYRNAWLEELLAEGALFEYWAHAACFVPIEDFPIYRRRMIERSVQYEEWMRNHEQLVQQLLSRMREQGRTRSSEWVRTEGKSSGWWDWKPEKHALEVLFMRGDVMVAERHNFQRIYSLREQVLPDWDDSRMVSEHGLRERLSSRAVRCLGIATLKWIPDYFRLNIFGGNPTARVISSVQAIVEQLLETGELIPVEIEGWETPAYVHLDNVGLVQSAAAGKLTSSVTTLLSPFDPVVWHRERASQLFNFVYQIETYTPKPKRKYGYFTLPILHRGELVGRLDPKAHRKERILEVFAIHLEPWVKISNHLSAGLRKSLSDFASWQGLDTVVIRQQPERLLRDTWVVNG